MIKRLKKWRLEGNSLNLAKGTVNGEIARTLFLKLGLQQGN